MKFRNLAKLYIFKLIMTKSNLKNSYDVPFPPSKILATSVIYLMYRQGNREDFYRFKVLKSLVWFVKEVSRGLMFFPLAGPSRGVACGRR